MMAKRVVRLDMAGRPGEGPSGAHSSAKGQDGEEGEALVPLYKVITNPAGFVNHFTGLNNQPNCQLVWKEGMPLGEHCLVVKSTKAIKAGKQWLLNYGPLHQCGVKPIRKRKRQAGQAPKGKAKGKKKAKTEEEQDAGAGADAGAEEEVEGEDEEEEEGQEDK